MTEKVQQYFTSVANQWDDIREGYFTEHMRDKAIERANLPENATVADIGTGTGFVAAGLIKHAVKVYGFDANPEMVEVAKRNLSFSDKVELQVAEGNTIPLPDNFLNGTFANMYLHHAPEPARTIKEMVRVLKPGGMLCITDLDTHDHEWQREQMADLWLGFERDDIRKWFEEAGLSEIDIDCAEGTCNACGPDGNAESLSIFVAIGKKN
jgi:ubiquinone/menaquinone biosynthesis C-methylase UbiE